MPAECQQDIVGGKIMQNSWNATGLILGAIAAPFGLALADLDPATGQWGGDVSAQNFSQYCEGELPADRQERFDTGVSQAEAALRLNDTNTAHAALNDAWRAAYRGGAENDLAVKCLGKETAKRWYKARIEIYRQQSAARGTSKTLDYETLYVASVDESSNMLVNRFDTLSPQSFVDGMQKLEKIVLNIENQRDFGAFILMEEVRMESTGTATLLLLKQQASEKHRRAMTAEDELFNRPPTDLELELSQTLADAEGFVAAFAGTGVAAEERKRSLLLTARANQSLEMLEDARIWSLTNDANVQTAPSAQRALVRGDFVLTKAEDETASLAARDSYYASAIRYYKFGSWNQQASNASSGKESIQAGLAAEQAQQLAALEKVGAALSIDAEEVRSAQQKMQKTEAEKQSFKDEAAALEAELGF